MGTQKRTWIVAFILMALLLSSGSALAKEKPAWNPPPYFAPEHYAEIEGMKICYVEAGEAGAPAIVFIHGWSGDIMNWWDQYEYFKDNYHVVILDDPGHGKSERRDDIKYSMPLDGKVVVGLMDYLGIKKAVLVGNSMGGHIVAWVAINYPERVEKLVLSDAAGSSDLRWLAGLLPLVNPTTLKLLNMDSGDQYKQDNPKNQARHEFIASFPGTSEEKPYLRALSRSLKSLALEPIKNDLPKITAPTLLIWGDNDPLVKPKVMDAFAARIPDTKRYLVPQGGHTPQMDTPAEFNCAVDKFVRGENMEDCRAKP